MIEIEMLAILGVGLGGVLFGLYAWLNNSKRFEGVIKKVTPHKSEEELKKEAEAERKRIADERRKRYEV